MLPASGLDIKVSGKEGILVLGVSKAMLLVLLPQKIGKKGKEISESESERVRKL